MILMNQNSDSRRVENIKDYRNLVVVKELNKSYFLPMVERFMKKEVIHLNKLVANEMPDSQLFQFSSLEELLLPINCYPKTAIRLSCTDENENSQEFHLNECITITESHMKNFQNLQKLRVNLLFNYGLMKMKDWRYLTNLTSLCINDVTQNNQPSDIKLSHELLPKLEKLEIMKGGDFSRSLFSQLTNLKELTLTKSTISEACFQDLTNLESLKIVGGLTAILYSNQSLGRLTNLNTLIIKPSDFTRNVSITDESISKLRKLKHLSLNSCFEITGQCLEKIAPSLITLSLEKCCAVDCQYFSKMKHLTHLRLKDMSVNKLNELSSLKYLYIYQCGKKLTSDSLIKLSNLEELFISSNDTKFDTDQFHHLTLLKSIGLCIKPEYLKLDFIDKLTNLKNIGLGNYIHENKKNIKISDSFNEFNFDTLKYSYCKI